MTASPIPAAGLAECRPATRAVRAGIDCDTAHGAVTPPLVLSSNFSFDGFGNKRDYDYTRSGNPTRDLLGDALATWGRRRRRGHRHRHGRDHLVLRPCSGRRYAGGAATPTAAAGAFNALAAKGHFNWSPPTSPIRVAAALAQSPKLVLIETPSIRCCDHRPALRDRGRPPRRRPGGGGQHLLSPALQK